ncbi:MAG: calcium/sodium antiporter [Methanosarcina flavescens]|uniref:Calcium/sodium antiporter n=1 Tax=Methanosarcina flavescens TaxID=1715806 RepID=A0A660HP46_9EURY|nr:calcium/sodium antiporter [Methanosarcina flavescens]AYK14061.1 sodium:calcium antiporter [Methanosarcina flavescens]NLK32653.1 calcium/sodium antiporter [Methanosarcina flavescens]
MPVINILVFLGGLVLLVRGADLFVLTSSLIARRFGVSEFVIGLTLVSVGTSVPELASSLAASFQQASGIVMGNILGSNIANIGLIAGMAALLTNIRTEEVMLRRDGYIMLFSSFLLFLFMLDFKISRLEALIFILLYLIYLLFLFEKVKKHEGDIYFKDFMIYIIKFEYIFDLISRINLQARRYREEKQGAGKKTERKNGTEKRAITESETESVTEEYEDVDIDVTEEHLQETSLLAEFFKLIASLAAIIIGANYFVEEAIFFAMLFDVPETIIGISLVAVGTSIPELMVTVSAARSDYGGIALGNVIGSNIANILLILGCSGLVHPIMTTDIGTFYIAPFMLIISTLFLLFIRTGWKVKRLEGVVMLLLYFGFMIMIISME